ncbi:MAG: NnrS family protein [Chromatiales bacterium]|nr:NnrS family protein [Chromatiales bacterium]
MMQIEQPQHYRYALHHLGFRPFFLLGTLFSVVAVAVWAWLYHSGTTLPMQALPAMTWHAHEMIYGYALAVIAGFLLTAVRNWTSVQTLHGWPLLLLALLWLLARLMPFIGHPDALLAMAALDLLFASWLCWEIFKPIYRVRQWSQLGILAKLIFLLLGQGFFYLGLFGVLEQGVQWGLYTGLYIVISLVLLMGRRVIPFFIEKGAGEPVVITNYLWVDRASLVLMLLLWIFAVFVENRVPLAITAFALFALHSIRLWGWHTPALWRKPMLWVLYLAVAWLVTGFLLTALGALGLISPMVGVHALAYGGIGMVTLGMMARVALGHTGRNVFDPPKLLGSLFALLFLGALVRVLLPLLLPQHYATLILVSQLLWIAAFAPFLFHYAPMLIKPRVDGSYG